MTDIQVPRAGTISKDGKNLAFYLDDYRLTIIDPYPSDVLFDEQYIYGKMHDNRTIAFYKGDRSLIVSGTKRIASNYYVVAKSSDSCVQWDKFDYLEFKGGTLNGLYYCSALKTKYEKCSRTISYQNDMFKCYFRIGDCDCSLEVSSVVSEKIGLFANRIENDEIRLVIKFSTPQPFTQAPQYIYKLKEMLSFMTFRSEVSFSQICLGCVDDPFQDKDIFLNDNTAVTSKNFFSNIGFFDLRESAGELANIIFNNEKDKPSYEIGFIPRTDKETGRIDNSVIRLVASALECEVEWLKDGDTPIDSELNNLIDKVKIIIKDHRESDKRLPNKIYDNIFGSLKNWSRSASDKFFDLYQRHRKEMEALIGRFRENYNSIDYDDINNFVKYRNSITHGRYKVLDEKIAFTAVILEGLVYCCILTRIGMEERQIISMIRNGKLLA